MKHPPEPRLPKQPSHGQHSSLDSVLWPQQLPLLIPLHLAPDISICCQVWFQQGRGYLSMAHHRQDIQLYCETADFFICYDLALKMSPKGSSVKGSTTTGRWWWCHQRPRKSCQDWIPFCPSLLPGWHSVNSSAWTCILVTVEYCLVTGPRQAGQMMLK